MKQKRTVSVAHTQKNQISYSRCFFFLLLVYTHNTRSRQLGYPIPFHISNEAKKKTNSVHASDTIDDAAAAVAVVADAPDAGTD